MANAAVIRSRIALAKSLIKKLDKNMKITSANRGIAKYTDKVGLTDHAAAVQRVYDVWDQNPDFANVNTPNANVIGSSVDEAHGNCDMRAELTYQLAYNRPDAAFGTQTTFAKVVVPGHAFCLMCDTGLLNGDGPYAIADFGSDAVVVDGWQSDYYAPNVWGFYGRAVGVEAFVVRKWIAHREITLYKDFLFSL